MTRVTGPFRAEPEPGADPELARRRAFKPGRPIGGLPSPLSVSDSIKARVLGAAIIIALAVAWKFLHH